MLFVFEFRPLRLHRLLLFHIYSYFQVPLAPLSGPEWAEKGSNCHPFDLLFDPGPKNTHAPMGGHAMVSTKAVLP